MFQYVAGGAFSTYPRAARITDGSATATTVQPSSGGRVPNRPPTRRMKSSSGSPPCGVARGSATQAPPSSQLRSSREAPPAASGSRAVASPGISPRQRPMSQSRRASCTSGA